MERTSGSGLCTCGSASTANASRITLPASGFVRLSLLRLGHLLVRVLPWLILMLLLRLRMPSRCISEARAITILIGSMPVDISMDFVELPSSQLIWECVWAQYQPSSDALYLSVVR